MTLTPSLTPTATDTAVPTLTPTETLIPTETALPSSTPEPVADFFYSNSRLVEIPESIRAGLNQPLLAFLNYNDRLASVTTGTASPANNVVTLYYSSPTTGSNRVPILEIQSDSPDAVYVAPLGNSVAYLLTNSDTEANGLWILNLSIETTARVSNLRTFSQRGLFSPPSWSPDGKTLALAMATGYDIDIFLIKLDASAPQSVTPQGSYDWLPVWSPDGRYLAFLSDRMTCPSWIPGEANACAAGVNPVPTSGQVYVLEVATGAITRVSDQAVSEAPVWVNSQLLGFASRTAPDDLLDQTRSLWLADVGAVIAGTAEARLVALQGSSDDRSNVAEVWSPDGTMVLYQETDNALVLMETDGTLISRSSDWAYPRFGVSVDWSPDSQRIAIGGVGGQCPYGRTVVNRAFEALAQALPPPSMCAPQWSPDGAFVAYTGIVPRATGAVDGRVDIYISDERGFGSTNLTGSLRGQIRLLGWVGPGSN
jgi:dipeptidyl aminopeptidase/acylaminoacyl peptidase